MVDRELVGPIQMREYPEWHAFAELAYEQRAYEAEDEIQPDRGGESPIDLFCGLWSTAIGQFSEYVRGNNPG